MKRRYNQTERISKEKVLYSLLLSIVIGSILGLLHYFGFINGTK